MATTTKKTISKKSTANAEIEKIEILPENPDIREQEIDNAIKEKEKKSKEKLETPKTEKKSKTPKFEVGDCILFDMPKEFILAESVSAEFDGHYKGEIFGDNLKYVRIIHKDGSRGIIIPLMIVKDKCKVISEA